MSKSGGGLRFLGFAFATADLLFEVDQAGLITLAVGATRKVTGREGSLTHLPSHELFDPSDQGVFAALIRAAAGALRKGPVRCRLKDVPGRAPRYANVYACSLPQLAPNISCALSLSADGPGNFEETGLLNRAEFDQAVGKLLAGARDSGLDVELALVEVAGLTKAISKLTKAEADTAVGGISDVLRAEALKGAATRLEDERFAIVREKPDGTDTLVERLRLAAADAGVAIEAEAAIVALGGADTAQSLRALRFTLDRFLKGGIASEDAAAGVFKEGLDGTLRQAKNFTEMVNRRQFTLVYQPIVELTTLEVNHYEALARFADGQGPFETIRMAEELDLIDTFDLAAIEMVVKTLRMQGPEVRIAVNVSGRSFLRPKFLDRVLELVGADARLKRRLMFEITESSALANLDLADERIQRLRRAGFEVCIDDFGAGAASLSYLRHLTVDVVKIDGQYVRELSGGNRDGVVVRHLTALCRELHVLTIAEMVECQSTADALREIGVDMGQGFLFGAPLEKIPPAAAVAPGVRPARRKGSVDTWG